jgi:APA family basic amino acid/polyamine antiporter
MTADGVVEPRSGANGRGEPELGLFDATMLVMGGIVGVGIFFTPGTVAGVLGDPTAFLLAWVLGGAVALCGALTFAELGLNWPQAGGWFVFLQRAFGPLPAFLFAWTILGVVSTGAIAVIAAFCAEQALSLLPGAAPAGTPAAAAAELWTAAGIVVALTLLALRGLRLGAAVQSAVMVAKFTAIAALGVCGVILGLGSAAGPLPVERAAPTGPRPSLWSGFAQAALPVFFSYGGWQNLCYAADRVRDPRRTLPRAILLGVGGAVALYLAVNLGFLLSFGTAELAERRDFAAALAERLLGPAGRSALQAAMAVSALGVCAVTVLLTPGIYVAMARAGLFFGSYGRLVGAGRVPAAALFTQGLLALGYLFWSHSEVWFGPRREGAMDLETLTSSVVFAEWIFHALVAAALLRLRREPQFAPLSRHWAVRLAPALYLAAALWVVAGNLRTNSGLETTVGLSAVGLGLLAFALWRGLTRRPDRPQ